MPRRKKCRRVGFIPPNQLFYPQNRSEEQVTLQIEELEAIRLSDLEQMEQNEAAEMMNISRGTFQRIIKSARQKVADALVNGKVIHIGGGHFELAEGGQGMCRRRRFRGGRG